mmetsp:Transcript_40192/g.114869  ORF Transcript_40192/g.114869 Transcript_40192/m.114869 type:complete len:111 (-) Transcript_40192:515-847(-)
MLDDGCVARSASNRQRRPKRRGQELHYRDVTPFRGHKDCLLVGGGANLLNAGLWLIQGGASRCTGSVQETHNVRMTSVCCEAKRRPTVQRHGRCVGTTRHEGLSDGKVAS